MEVEVKNYLFQRKMLGILCGLLAPTSVLFGLFGAEHNLPGWYMSVSATYYASSKMCMIGLLFCASIFFMNYYGYDWRDRAISIIQSVASLGVLAFPTRTPMAPPTVGIFDLPIDISHILHCTSASILFIAFGVNIMFLFTLGDEKKNEKKRQRNLIYRICASIIFIFCIIQALSKTVIFDWVPDWFPFTLFNEFVMLEAFAVAWIVKSESIKMLNDEAPQASKE